MPCRYLPSVSQPSKIGRGVISNQHALVGSMGFFPALTTTGMASTHIGVRLLAPEPFGRQATKVYSGSATSTQLFSASWGTTQNFPGDSRSLGYADDVAGVHARRFRIRLTGRGTPGEGSLELNRTQIPESCFPENGGRPLDSVSKCRAWGDSNARRLVPKTISNEKSNLLNENQKVMQPSQVQPVQQKWQIDLRRGEMRQVA